MQRNPLARFAWLTLAANIVVILWGAVVRITGSGDGCGSNWPLCDGEVIPTVSSFSRWVEYSHRVTSGLALILVFVLWIRCLRTGRRELRLGATLALIFILAEAAIGAGLVKFGLVADNASSERALVMASHLGNTFLLLAALTLTAHWAAGGSALTLAGGRRHRRLVRWAGMALLATLLIGVSGAVTALGDTLFPPESHGEALAAGLSPTSHILIQLRLLHPLFAVLGSLVVLYFASEIKRLRQRPAARRYGKWLSLLVLLQLAVGAVNIQLRAPVPVQLFHLLLADAVWVLLVLAVATSLAASAEPAHLATTADRSS